MLKTNDNMRFDLSIIASWIEPGSRVLGLGCGEGELLYFLKKNRQVKETGIEIVESKVASCIEKGLSVLQGDINEEITDYPDSTFDYVILSQTLQQVYEPSDLIRNMLRIGRKAIVSFPNFCHWRIRLQLLLTGHVPITKELPDTWYNTPNIRVISVNDFRKYSREIGFEIINEVGISPGLGRDGNRITSFFPNLFAAYGIFLIGKSYS